MNPHLACPIFIARSHICDDFLRQNWIKLSTAHNAQFVQSTSSHTTDWRWLWSCFAVGWVLKTFERTALVHDFYAEEWRKVCAAIGQFYVFWWTGTARWSFKFKKLDLEINFEQNEIFLRLLSLVVWVVPLFPTTELLFGAESALPFPFGVGESFGDCVERSFALAGGPFWAETYLKHKQCETTKTFLYFYH